MSSPTLLLQQQIERAEPLKQLPKYSPEYKIWCNTTMKILREHFTNEYADMFNRIWSKRSRYANQAEERKAFINLKRADVFITNVVKCRPPGNRDPLPAEINACNNYLERQIAAINPQVIVTLGRFSMAKFFGGEKISAIHGRARKIDGRMCIAMYHPAAGLHQQSLKDTIRADFKKIPLVVAEAERLAGNGQMEAEPPKTKEEPPEQLALF